MKLFKITNSRAVAPRAFTLIEIALCLGIIGFALVAIIAVLPRGLDVQKRNREETIIAHDADIWMSNLRSGARGSDDLTNYVLCITNFWTTYDANFGVVKSDFDYYTPTNSARRSISPATDDFPLTNGAHIVGLLSTPKFTPYPVGGPLDVLHPPYQSNYVVAYVRALSGSAVDKAPETNAVVLGDAFIYRMIVENYPYVPVDTNGICMDCVYTNGLTAAQLAERSNQARAVWLMQTNLNDIRLKFRWPVLPNGKILNFDATFRAMADGRVLQTNDPNNTLQPLYFVESSTFYQSLAKP